MWLRCYTLLPHSRGYGRVTRTIFALVSKAAVRADTSRMASLKSSESIALAKTANRSDLGCAVSTARPAGGCLARQQWRLRTVCAKDVGEPHFPLTCFSLEGHQCMGGEALLPLLTWVAWKPTAEPTLAQAELQADP